MAEPTITQQRDVVLRALTENRTILVRSLPHPPEGVLIWRAPTKGELGAMCLGLGDYEWKILPKQPTLDDVIRRMGEAKPRAHRFSIFRLWEISSDEMRECMLSEYHHIFDAVREELIEEYENA